MNYIENNSSNIIIIIAILIIGFILYINNKNASPSLDVQTTSGVPNNEIDVPTSDTLMPTSSSQTLVIKYFGSKNCPHSKIGSRAYLLIKDFEKVYPQVKVEYYWNEDSSDEFVLAQVEYVPTITDNLYNKIELALPNGVDTTNKTEKELKNLVLSNTYNQLL